VSLLVFKKQNNCIFNFIYIIKSSIQQLTVCETVNYSISEFCFKLTFCLYINLFKLAKILFLLVLTKGISIKYVNSSEIF